MAGPRFSGGKARCSFNKRSTDGSYIRGTPILHLRKNVCECAIVGLRPAIVGVLVALGTFQANAQKGGGRGPGHRFYWKESSGPVRSQKRSRVARFS